MSASRQKSVYGIPAFSDNYIWLLDNGDGTAQVVDPGDAAPVERALEERGLSLAAILLTHHHFDHVGGVAALKRAHRCPVYGPDNPRIAEIDHRLSHGEHLAIGAYDFEIIAVPGHTLDHIAYYHSVGQHSVGQHSAGQHSAGQRVESDSVEGEGPLLFCGDTLFAGGCGRIFEGDPPMMYASLQRLADLPPETAVFCAHEYTLANLRFARVAEPGNAALAERERLAMQARREGRPTVPSTIALELATNPFLRSTEEGILRGLESAGRSGRQGEPVAAFAELRAWKDSF